MFHVIEVKVEEAVDGPDENDCPGLEETEEAPREEEGPTLEEASATRAELSDPSSLTGQIQ